MKHIDDLKGLQLVGVAGYNSTEQLKDVFESLLSEVASPIDALVAVDNGEADVYVGSWRLVAITSMKMVLKEFGEH